MTIVVTGATGNVGTPLVRALLARGLSVRIASKAPSTDLPAVSSTVLDLSDPSTFQAALAGARALFLLRPPAISEVRGTINRLADVAHTQGVEHIVFLSVLGADTRSYIPHYKVERHLEALGVPYTFLRAGFFAQNLGDAYRRDIQADDRIYVPAGPSRAAFVDARDLAEVAALAFARPADHANRAHVLVGPEALSFTEVAGMLSAVLERPIRYEAANPVAYAWHVHRQGRPWTQAVVQTALHVGLRFGQAERLDGTLEKLLGRPATRVATYVRDHAALWSR